MDTNLNKYLKSLNLSNREQWDWGSMQLQADLYLTQKLPQQKLVTSVRGIIFKGDQVLVVYNDHEQHILPGGRRERGETYLETVKRECLEETCWDIEVQQVLAVTHCQHQTPKPDKYVYPYPDFCQIIYVARATTYYPDRMIDDEYVTGAEFRPIADVKKLELTPNQHTLLDAALKVNLP